MSVSATKKGLLFENKVFLILKSLLEDDELFIPTKYSCIFQRKKYYSKDRDDSIIVDISIETTLKGTDEYSLLTLIECKDYKSYVPVDDIEEFKAKIDQIAGKNTKGILVTSYGFQKSTIQYAKALGIGLIRILPEDNINWDVYRTTNTKKTIERENGRNSDIFDALTIHEYKGTSEYFYAILGDEYSSSLCEYFSYLGIQYTRNISNVDYLPTIEPEKNEDIDIPYSSRDEIEAKAEELLKNIDPAVLVVAQKTSIENVVEYIMKKYHINVVRSLDLGRIPNGEVILGRIDIKNKEIQISKILDSDEYRYRFTLAHEIGHCILHYEYFEKSYIETAGGELVYSNTKINNGRGRMEWQANSFAAALLLPGKTFFRELTNIVRELNLRNKKNCLIYLDNQTCNIENYNIIATRIKNKYHVSKKVFEYHVKNHELMIDERKNEW